MQGAVVAYSQLRIAKTVNKQQRTPQPLSTAGALMVTYLEAELIFVTCMQTAATQKHASAV
jgi:hypothetical protein